MIRQLYQDDRALALDFVKLVMSLGIGALVLWAIYQSVDPMLADARAKAPGGMGGIEMNDWFATAGDVWPGIFLGVAFFGFLARAVVLRRAA